MSTVATQVVISGKDQLSSVVADAGRRLGTELQGMQRNVLGLQNAFMAVAGAADLGRMRRVYSDYEASLKDMVKVTDVSQAEIAEKMQAIPEELGTSTELIQGYYQVISAGITDPVKAMDTLTGSVEAAKAAHLGQSEVIKGITKLMAGYAGEVATASDAADLLFAIEKQGQTNFAELIPVIGDVAAVSRVAGVAQEEMGAALAAVTQTSGSTSQAATQYRMLLVNLLKPTKDMREALDAMGVSSGKVAIEQFGLAGTVRRLQEYADRSGKSMAKLFESSEAFLAVAALSRNDFGRYLANLEAMEKRTGAADRAFQEWLKSTQAVDDLFSNTMTNTLIKIGKQVMPAVNVAVQDFAEYVDRHGDEIAGVFGEMAEHGRQIGSAMVPALKEVGHVLSRDVVPAVSGVTRGASDLLSLVPADYQSTIGGGIIGYALLGPKGALIGATIAGIRTALDDLWGNEAASKQGENIERVLAAAEARLESAQRRLRQAERLPGNNSGALQSAQSDIDRETALIGRLTAAKAKVAGVQKTFSDTWGEIERKSMAGVRAVAVAAPAIVAPSAAAITTLGSSAETALAKVRAEVAKLSMTEAEYSKFQLSEEYAKLVKELGAANPALQEWLALKERDIRLTELATLKPYQVTQLEGMNRGDMFYGKADADKRAMDMLRDQGRENLQLQTEFADKYKEIVLGETEFKLEQIRLQGEAYAKAGSDEVAVAQWVEAEKLKYAREWQDGAIRGLRAYADEATNAAKHAEQIVTRAFEGMTDAVVDFAMTGKFEFSSFADSVIRDMLRVMAQQNITGPLAGAAGDFIKYLVGGASTASVMPSGGSGLYYSVGHHSGGIVGSEPTFVRPVPASAYANAPRYHDGFMPDEYPAILKRGEGVFTPGQMRALGGGGNVNVVIHNYAPGTQAKANVREDGNGGKSIEVIVDEIQARNTSRPGSQTSRSLRNDYNLRPSLTRR